MRMLPVKPTWSGPHHSPAVGEPLLLTWGDSRSEMEARAGSLRTLVLGDPLLDSPPPSVTGGAAKASQITHLISPQFLLHPLSFPICVFSVPVTSYQAVGDFEIHKAVHFSLSESGTW